jgi:hypothetical protein
MLKMVGSRLRNLNNGGMWNSLLRRSFQNKFLCFDLLLKDDEKSSGHVNNNLMILLKKSLDFVDHTSVEVLVRLQDFQLLDYCCIPQTILERLGSNVEDLKLEAMLLP